MKLLEQLYIRISFRTVCHLQLPLTVARQTGLQHREISQNGVVYRAVLPHKGENEIPSSFLVAEPG